jgi:hypothetical protein
MAVARRSKDSICELPLRSGDRDLPENPGLSGIAASSSPKRMSAKKSHLSLNRYRIARLRELSSPLRRSVGMERLREFRLVLVGAENAPARPISVLAASPTIALIQGATLAMDYGAHDFSVYPGKRPKALSRAMD